MAKSHSQSQIAKRYATALFQLANKEAEKLLAEAESLREVTHIKEVDAFFHNPLLTREEQAETVKALLEKQGFSELLVDAVVRIALNRRLPLLAQILEQFKTMVMEASGEMEVEIISAKPLSKSDVETLTAHLSKNYGKTIHVQAKTDPSLIGGIMLKMQDALIDYSVAGKLNRIHQQLKSVPVA